MKNNKSVLTTQRIFWWYFNTEQKESSNANNFAERDVAFKRTGKIKIAKPPDPQELLGCPKTSPE